MTDQPTCGQGMAEHAGLPLALAELEESLAENLDGHVGTLDLTDEHARTEHDVWVEVAERHRAVAAALREAADLMARQRDLPMARHDPAALSSASVAATLRRLVAAERSTVGLLETWMRRYEQMLQQAPATGD
jgi:hypothetical protein